MTPSEELELRRLGAAHRNEMIIGKLEAEITWFNHYCPPPAKTSPILAAFATVFVFYAARMGLDHVSLLLAVFSGCIFCFNELSRMWTLWQAKKSFKRYNSRDYYRVFSA
jgi:hypothetical protein